MHRILTVLLIFLAPALAHSSSYKYMDTQPVVQFMDEKCGHLSGRSNRDCVSELGNKFEERYNVRVKRANNYYRNITIDQKRHIGASIYTDVINDYLKSNCYYLFCELAKYQTLQIKTPSEKELAALFRRTTDMHLTHSEAKQCPLKDSTNIFPDTRFNALDRCNNDEQCHAESIASAFNIIDEVVKTIMSNPLLPAHRVMSLELHVDTQIERVKLTDSHKEHKQIVRSLMFDLDNLNLELKALHKAASEECSSPPPLS